MYQIHAKFQVIWIIFNAKPTKQNNSFKGDKFHKFDFLNISLNFAEPTGLHTLFDERKNLHRFTFT